MTLNGEPIVAAEAIDEAAVQAVLRAIDAEEGAIEGFQQINLRRAACENPEALRILRAL